MPDNRMLIVDALLVEVARELDIPPSKYREAVERFEAVGRWLEGGEYPGAVAEPHVSVQGSFRLGTIVRPLPVYQTPEYDIDLVCDLGILKATTSAATVKELVGDRLKAHGRYRDMLDDEGRRCWTLAYAEADGIGFHLDVLPCVPDPSFQPGVEQRHRRQSVALTNSVSGRYHWGRTNPAGYADWFFEQQREAFSMVAGRSKAAILASHPDLFARVDDVPDQLVRTPLQRAIQILKRHRDVRFNGREDEGDKPISMIISTLAARGYQQEPDVYSTLAGFVHRMRNYQESHAIRCDGDEWNIPNPVNPEENFADRWNEPGSKKAEAFFQWIDWIQEDIDDLLNASTRGELESKLCGAFGDRAGHAVAARYAGPLPGAQLSPTSAFGRVPRAWLRLDAAHRQSPKWRMQPVPHKVDVQARYFRNGFRPTRFSSNGAPLPKRIDLEFHAVTDIPKPYEVHWQVVNTGAEATVAQQLRGDFYRSDASGRKRSESTLYSGMHWIECFVVKNGVCVARSGEFVVNIA